MIEVASAPSDLSTWDSDKTPFYLEVFGEVSPVLDMTYAEVVPPNSTSPQATRTARCTSTGGPWAIRASSPNTTT